MLLRAFFGVFALSCVSTSAAQTFHATPRHGLKLRCPLLLSQSRLSSPVWRDPINRGLLWHAATYPQVTFFRHLLGERLELEFADSFIGKAADHVRARGQFLSNSALLEMFFQFYGVDDIDELPPHARHDIREVYAALENLFQEYSAHWIPRIPPARGFQLTGGVLAGVTVDLTHFFERDDGLTANQAIDAFARKLPQTIYAMEIFGGTAEQLAHFLRWDTKGRFSTLTLMESLGPVEPVIAALLPHVAKLRSITFDGYGFTSEQLELLPALGAAVATKGVTVEDRDDLWMVGLALEEGTLHDPLVRHIAWRNLLLFDEVSGWNLGAMSPANAPHLVADMTFLVDEPAFWTAAQKVGPEKILPLYESLPMKAAELRSQFLRKMLLHLSPTSLTEFAQRTMTTETETRRKVSAAGALLADIFASDLLREYRFGALRALRAIDALQQPREPFAESQRRWLVDARTDDADKAEYVAHEIGDPLVRTILEEAPQNEYWNAVRKNVEETTMIFAWRALEAENRKTSDALYRGLAKEKKRWTFSPVGDGTEDCDASFHSALFSPTNRRTAPLPERLNAWAAARGHRYRYALSPRSSLTGIHRRLSRSPAAP